MTDLAGRVAVVTGGGSGIGRALVLQLLAAGCRVASCDINAANLQETLRLAEAAAAADIALSLHSCDVADEAAVMRFADEVLQQHAVDHINLLFNNAGIAGGGSFINDEREHWENTFGVCWGGVYNCCRVFVPLLVASTEGHIINVSSVNGFWACMGPHFPHTAYSAAKFAVKGFSEALRIDCRMNAPHVKVSVVMPGHIGTSIVINSQEFHGGTDPAAMTAAEIDAVRRGWMKINDLAQHLSDDQVREQLVAQPENFRDNAPTTADQAATIILNGVREERWRILVGDDAVGMDKMVREDPENAYEVEFFARMQAGGMFDSTSI